MSYFPAGGGGGAVASVNGFTGAVVLDGGDVAPINAADITKTVAGEKLIGTVTTGTDVPFGEITMSAAIAASSVVRRDGSSRTQIAPPASVANTTYAVPLSTVLAATTGKPEIVALTGASTAADIVAALKAVIVP